MAAKQTLFTKYTCHEVNYFLYKRDQDFYQKVVRNLVENKLEKTFVDWYLLGMDTKPLFLEKILAFIENPELLNHFELCLLIEVCMLKGTPSHVRKAKAFVDIFIQSEKSKEESEPYYKNGNTQMKIFDAILKM